MKRLILIPIILLATCGAAQAEFTAQEKANVLLLLNANVQDKAAGREVALYLAENPGNLADIPNGPRNEHGRLVARMVKEALGHRNGSLRAIFILADCARQGCDADDFLPRDQMVAQAMLLVEERQTDPDPFERIDDLIAACPVNCGRLVSARAKTVKAREIRAGFNLTLEYLEPRLDDNLAMPGTSREISPVGGPHGDYMRMLNRVEHTHRYAGHACNDSTEGWELHVSPSMSNGIGAGCKKTSGIQEKMGQIMGLMMGVESPKVAAGIDTQLANSNTNRGRSFWQLSAILDIFLDGGVRDDVFGVRSLRGVPADFVNACGAFRSGMRSDPSVPEWMRRGIFGMYQICDAWNSSDQGAWAGIGFLNFTNVGRPPDKDPTDPTDPSPTDPAPMPPPGDEPTTCGPGTVMVGTECLPENETVICGRGTFQDGRVCLPVPQTCPSPSFHVVLSEITPGSFTFECKEQ